MNRLNSIFILISISLLIGFSSYGLAQELVEVEGNITTESINFSAFSYDNRIFLSRISNNLEFTNFGAGVFQFLVGSNPNSAFTKFTISDDGIGINTFSGIHEELEIGGTGRAFFGDGGGSNRKGLLIDGISGASATRIESYDYGTNTGLDLIINSVGEGKVGIDITDPSHILHINGIGRSTQSTWATSSDGRVKQNIRSVDNAIMKILKLNPVIFDWKDSYKKYNPSLTDNRYGFIAQEVSEVIPQMVSQVKEKYGDETIEDFNVLSTDALFPLIVKALQEQQDTIDRQNEAIEDQKALINDLLQRMSRLENKM